MEKTPHVRWMDDQNIGVNSFSEGLSILSAVDVSQRRLHLTTNVGKSKILSLSKAKCHFHFQANRELDILEVMGFDTERGRRALRKKLSAAWKSALVYEGEGEWQKVLKRFYRIAARGRTRILKSRAISDVIEFPTSVNRISDYLRYILPPCDYIDFVERLLNDTEQVYPHVNHQLVESLLRLEPEQLDAIRIRQLAQNIHSGRLKFQGSNDCRDLVPLLFLRYGDKRNIKGLAGKCGKKLNYLPPTVTRSICSVLASCGPAEFAIVRNAASQMLRNHLSEFVKMIERIQRFDSVPGRFKVRIKISFDSITRAKYMDMRSVLAFRLLGLCPHQAVRKWLADTKNDLIADELSDFDKRLILRLWTKF